MKENIIIIGMSILFFLCSLFLLHRLANSAEWHYLTQRPLKVNIRQLPLDSLSKMPAVEIVSPSSTLRNKKEIDQFSCYVKNNTIKHITALVLTLKVTLKGKQGEFTDTTTLAHELLLHPDIKDERNLNSLYPELTHKMQLSRPIKYKGDVSVERIDAEIKCALFDDDTFLGFDSNGVTANTIIQVRDGADQYKQWFKRQITSQKLQGDSALLQQLTSKVPTEPDFSNQNLKQGADIYRKWLYKVVKSKGSDRAITYLNGFGG